MAWLIAIFVLGLLVLLHELGHFVVARRCGVRVLRFSIGFGPVLWRWKRGHTEYAVSLLPLGGYVKMAGESRPSSELPSVAGEPWEFSSKPVGVRAWIVAAGPLVNYAISILSLWTVLVIGYPELLPTVGRLIEDMPARAAGVQVGDRIMAVEGTPIRTWDELTRIIHRSANRPLSLAVQRDDATLTLRVTPLAREQMDPFGRARTVGLLGVSPSGAFTTYRVSPLEAVHQTASKQVEWLSQTGLSLWSMVTGRVPMQESMTGPIGIVYMTSEAVRMGLGALLYLVSIFSLSLAIFNFFPIPILDGGHLLFLVCEKFRGRPVSLSVQERAAQISFALLMTMVVLVCFNDLNRLGVVEKLRGFWRG